MTKCNNQKVISSKMRQSIINQQRKRQRGFKRLDRSDMLTSKKDQHDFTKQQAKALRIYSAYLILKVFKISEIKK